jgi:predicted dehydrogenase
MSVWFFISVKELGNMAKYRVGLIGCGRKGGQHGRAYVLNPSTEVVALADTDAENLELYSGFFGVPGYADYREMIEKEQIDIAAPILPVGPNPEVVIGCAEAGVKAILCEKPLGTTLAETDRMVEACASRGIKFGAGDMDRNLPYYWQARQLIDAGELGEVCSITFVGGSGVEISGGGCQQLSLMRHFAGDAEVDFVIGWVSGDPFSDEDQGAAGYVRFVNGIEATLQRQRDARGSGFDVACTGGLIQSRNGVLRLWKTEEGGELKEVEGLFPDGSVMGNTSGSYVVDGWKWPGDRNTATVQSIVDALDQDIEPRSNGDNGRKVLELAIALRQSHRQGHAPVKLPLEDRSLTLYPRKSRLENKKPDIGPKEYIELISTAMKG